CKVQSVLVSEDAMSVKLQISGLKLGYVHEIVAEGIRSQSGAKLLHNKGYYTLNQLPGGVSPMISEASGEVEVSGEGLNKNQTSLPADWDEATLSMVEVGTEPGMKYDIKQFSVKAGTKVKLEFQNTDDMAHNLVIVAPGTADGISKAALDMGIAGLNAGYIPESGDVLSHTTLVEPGETESIYFEAPSTTGYYQFVCTVPGHNVSMRGVMLVEK
ncbi:MAG: plastocyanin/azurin family copper-binding protein, partial [Bacteroidota bacterium]